MEPDYLISEFLKGSLEGFIAIINENHGGINPREKYVYISGDGFYISIDPYPLGDILRVHMRVPANRFFLYKGFEAELNYFENCIKN